MKTHKLTDDHINQFKARMGHWQAKLNLMDWRIEETTGRASKGAMAEVAIDPEAKLACFRVGRNWGTIEPTPENIDATACHESLHVMLRPLIDASTARDEQAIASAEHSVITVLERLLTK